MQKTVTSYIALSLAILALAACQAPGENLKANVYRSDQVNTAQQAMIAVVRQLEDEGVVSLKGNGGDDQFVV